MLRRDTALVEAKLAIERLYSNTPHEEQLDILMAICDALQQHSEHYPERDLDYFDNTPEHYYSPTLAQELRHLLKNWMNERSMNEPHKDAIHCVLILLALYSPLYDVDFADYEPISLANLIATADGYLFNRQSLVNIVAASGRLYNPITRQAFTERDLLAMNIPVPELPIQHIDQNLVDDAIANIIQRDFAQSSDEDEDEDDAESYSREILTFLPISRQLSRHFANLWNDRVMEDVALRHAGFTREHLTEWYRLNPNRIFNEYAFNALHYVMLERATPLQADDAIREITNLSYPQLALVARGYRRAEIVNLTSFQITALNDSELSAAGISVTDMNEWNRLLNRDFNFLDFMCLLSLVTTQHRPTTMTPRQAIAFMARLSPMQISEISTGSALPTLPSESPINVGAPPYALAQTQPLAEDLQPLEPVAILPSAGERELNTSSLTPSMSDLSLFSRSTRLPPLPASDDSDDDDIYFRRRSRNNDSDEDSPRSYRQLRRR